MTITLHIPINYPNINYLKHSMLEEHREILIFKQVYMANTD